MQINREINFLGCTGIIDNAGSGSKEQHRATSALHFGFSWLGGGSPKTAAVCNFSLLFE